MRFVDYKCEDCDEVTEMTLNDDSGTGIKCKKCGSEKMVRVFAPVGFKSSSDSSGSGSSSCTSCSGGSCSTCGSN